MTRSTPLKKRAALALAVVLALVGPLSSQEPESGPEGQERDSRIETLERENAALSERLEALENAARTSYRDYEPQPGTLTEEELAELHTAVMVHCGLNPNSNRENAPWFFQYELGLELERRGDLQRALDALVEATDRRPDSKKSAHTYGLWYLHYLPYHKIARLHLALGNRQCALNALRISEAQREFVLGDEGYREIVSLREGLAPFLEWESKP